MNFDPNDAVFCDILAREICSHVGAKTAGFEAFSMPACIASRIPDDALTVIVIVPRRAKDGE